MTCRMVRLPWRLGIRQFKPRRSPGCRVYSENGLLDAPMNRPWLGMTTAA